MLSGHEEAHQVAHDLQASLPATEYEVHTWQELMPFITAILKVYDAFVFLWFLVVFIAMAFGIVNTTLMAVFERIREFGLLKAMGMKPGHIVRQILLESALMLIVGVICGNILAYLSIAGFAQNGIDLTALAAGAEFAGMSRVIIESCFLLILGMVIGNSLGFLSVFALSGSGIDLSSLAKGLEFAGMSRVIYPTIYSKDIIMANLVVFILGLLVSLYPATKAAKFTPIEAMVRT